MENSKLLTILVQVDEGIKTPFKAHNEILSLFGVVGSFVCQDCEKPSKEYRDNLCEPCHKWHTGS